MAKQQKPAQSLYEVRNSPIHGTGLFARRTIEPEETILEYVGERIDKEESNRRGLQQMERAKDSAEGAVYIFEVNDEYDLDGNHPDNDARLMNHSCDPNCEAQQDEEDRIWLVAVKTVQAGEELTFDYGYDIAHFLDHPCKCGSPNCVGYIVRTDQRDQLKKMIRKSRKSAEARKSGRKRSSARRRS